MPAPEPSRFDQLVTQNELRPEVAAQLKQVLSTCEIVLLCDDSDSMTKPIAEEGTDAFAPKRSTRWLELKKLAASIIDFVTAINPDGLDIYFLNRPPITKVTSIAGLQITFGTPPSGKTPLIAAINQIYYDKGTIPANKNLLIVVITDGEPTDGSRDDLRRTLINKRDNVHISFAECTDNADDMEYLDQWDGQIRNFDNTDDYREELARVKNVQGSQFKFDFTDYVIKILLATFVRWYFNLDQVRVNQNYAVMPAPVRQFQPAQQLPVPVPIPQVPLYPPPAYPSPVVVTTQTSYSGPPPPAYQPRRQKRNSCSIL